MRASRAHRAVVFAICGVLALACIVPLTRLRFDADVLHLMPRDTGPVRAFERYLGAFGSLDALYLVVEAPDGYAVADYRDLVDALVEELDALPQVARVDAGPRDSDKDWSYLADRQLLLLDEVRLEEALSRLRPEEARARVAASRDLVAVGTPEVKALVQRDPLGWFELLRPAVGGATPIFGIDPSQLDGYVTPDGRARLLLVYPTEPPFDTTFARSVLDAIDGARARALATVADVLAVDELPPPRIDVAGGHRTAIETEALVRSEAMSNTALSTAGILGVLFLAFRNWWVVLVGGLPILLSTMLTLAAHQVWGVELAAAAAGSSAMLFGLGDDGLVLLFVAYRAALARGLSPLEAVSSLGGTGVSIMLGAVTTTATFLALWFMSFPSLQQLGVIVGVGILLSALLTLTLLVAALPGAAWASQARDLTLPSLARFVTRHRGPILVGSLLLTVALGSGVTRLSVDPSLERLRPRGDGFALEQELIERFGLPRNLLLVVSEGPALDAQLQAHARLASVAAGVPDAGLTSATMLLPDAATQARRAAALAAARDAIPEAIEAVNAAGREAGFVAGTFAPFAERLATVLDPAARVTREGYEAHGLGDIVGRFVADGPDGPIVVSYATPASPEARDALAAAVAAEPSLVLTGIPVVNATLAERFPRELGWGLGAGAIVVLLLIWMEFRAIVPTLHALVPTVLGLLWGLGALGWAGVQLDLFSIFAVLMFLGIGVDYGIHLVHPTLRAQDARSARHAIAIVGPAMLLAGVTTLVGFGTLIRSDYAPLYSLGLASSATIGASLVAALLTLPALLVAREGTRP